MKPRAEKPRITWKRGRPLCPLCGRPMVRWLGLSTIDWEKDIYCEWYRCPRCRIQLCIDGNQIIYGFKEHQPEWPVPEA